MLQNLFGTVVTENLIPLLTPITQQNLIENAPHNQFASPVIPSPLWPAGSVRTACSMSPYGILFPSPPADGSSVPPRRKSEANGRKETL
ncbi:hypothetical protein HNY73_003352 [Argiope bruennichi]|uniref:Uncharacterized protein n=1 Tax=Argiope bruennichi TaxID=94029 RepID=A0A8T0FMQ4_ARGBR|nr:hypothetical protein HNY73_003352 [Argiope bruennichi]